MAEPISAPSCGKCRFQIRAFGVAFDVFTRSAGVPDSAQAIGLHICEHPIQPRGLVPTYYSCRYFEHPIDIDQLDVPSQQQRQLK